MLLGLSMECGEPRGSGPLCARLRSASRRAVPAVAAKRLRQLLDLLQRHVCDAGHDKLGNAVAVLDSKRSSGAKRPHGDEDLAPVVGVESAKYQVDAPAS